MLAAANDILYMISHVCIMVTSYGMFSLKTIAMSYEFKLKLLNNGVHDFLDNRVFVY